MNKKIKDVLEDIGIVVFWVLFYCVVSFFAKAWALGYTIEEYWDIVTLF